MARVRNCLWIFLADGEAKEILVCSDQAVKCFETSAHFLKVLQSGEVTLLTSIWKRGYDSILKWFRTTGSSFFREMSFIGKRRSKVAYDPENSIDQFIYIHSQREYEFRKQKSMIVHTCDGFEWDPVFGFEIFGIDKVESLIRQDDDAPTRLIAVSIELHNWQTVLKTREGEFSTCFHAVSVRHGWMVDGAVAFARFTHNNFLVRLILVRFIESVSQMVLWGTQVRFHERNFDCVCVTFLFLILGKDCVRVSTSSRSDCHHATVRFAGLWKPTVPWKFREPLSSRVTALLALASNCAYNSIPVRAYSEHADFGKHPEIHKEQSVSQRTLRIDSKFESQQSGRWRNMNRMSIDFSEALHLVWWFHGSASFFHVLQGVLRSNTAIRVWDWGIRLTHFANSRCFYPWFV